MMKKLFALLLAAMMVCAMATAFATSSPDISDTTTVTTNNNTTTAAEEETEELIALLPNTVTATEDFESKKGQIDAGTPAVNVFQPETTEELLKLVSENAQLVEYATIGLTDAAKGATSVTFTLTFPTKFTKDQKVAAVISCFKGEETNEFVVPGTVNDDGSVTFTIGKDIIDAMAEAETTTIALLVD